MIVLQWAQGTPTPRLPAELASGEVTTSAAMEMGPAVRCYQRLTLFGMARLLRLLHATDALGAG